MLNNIKIHNHEEFIKQVKHRGKGKSLITISNHDSMIDDPIFFGSIMQYSMYLKAMFRSPECRWILGAREVCFSHKLHSLIFRLGKTLPIVRGDGIYQQSMNEIIEELNQGEWVHIYPEGKINEKKEFIRLKWGTARLVADSVVTPIVLPCWHFGKSRISC